MRYLKKRNIIIVATIIAIFSLVGIAVAATIPGVTFTHPASSAYLLKGSTVSVDATITNYPTATNFYYNDVSQGALTKLPSSDTAYHKDWTPTTWYKPANSGNTWYFLTGKINGYNSAGTGSATRPMYVTVATGQSYSSNDISWNYTSDTLNSIRGVGTGTGPAADGTYGTYNCLAYALGIMDHWVWPWYSSPTYSQLQTLFGNYGYYYSSTSVMPWTKIIYYNGDHFAKVVSWDSAGMPTSIISKWGAWEMIQSSGYNPFFIGSYGVATYYFK